MDRRDFMKMAAAVPCVAVVPGAIEAVAADDPNEIEKMWTNIKYTWEFAGGGTMEFVDSGPGRFESVREMPVMCFRLRVHDDR